MSKNIWGGLLIAWLIFLGLSAPYIKSVFGDGIIVKAVFVVVGLMGVIAFYTKYEEKE